MVVVYDGLKDPLDHMGTVGHIMWACWPYYLDVQSLDPAIADCNDKGCSEVASGITGSSGSI